MLPTEDQPDISVSNPCFLALCPDDIVYAVREGTDTVVVCQFNRTFRIADVRSEYFREVRDILEERATCARDQTSYRDILEKMEESARKLAEAMERLPTILSAKV